MNWLDIDSALNHVRQFLTRWQSVISDLDRNVRPSSVFECYSYISAVEAYGLCGYKVQCMGPSGQIVFKRSVTADPGRFTYFVVSNSSNIHEIRLNQGYRNADEVYFNLDIAVTRVPNCLNRGTLESQDMHTFCECKHYRAFYPSTCAYFVGLARMVMPFNIFWLGQPNTLYNPCPPPALLVSGNASSHVHKMVSVVRRKRYHIRFFDNISPRGQPQTILRQWIIGSI